MADTEKQFEADIEAFLVSPDGGWAKASDTGYRSAQRDSHRFHQVNAAYRVAAF